MGVSNLFIVLVSNCLGLFLNSELGFFLSFVIRTLVDKWDGRMGIPTCNKKFLQVVKRGSTRWMRSMVSSEAQQKQVENLSVIAWGWLSSYRERLFGYQWASQLDLLVRSSYLLVNIFFSSGLPPFLSPHALVQKKFWIQTQHPDGRPPTSSDLLARLHQLSRLAFCRPSAWRSGYSWSIDHTVIRWANL